MPIDHSILHTLSIVEGDVSLDSGLVLEGEFAVEERGGFVAGEPVGESCEGVEVVVVIFEVLLCHWREILYDWRTSLQYSLFKYMSINGQINHSLAFCIHSVTLWPQFGS